MRKDTTLYYLLSDHLGSTSIVTDAVGTVVSQTKYKAWGEVRHQSGPSLTEYTYTGQYSYTGSFGLMYYNARWYDPYLNHMTQPDSIVPDPYNSQDYDRYAYARNNPMRYTDPSGHVTCEGANWDDGPRCLENPKSPLSRIVKLNREFKEFDFTEPVGESEMILIEYKLGNQVIADAELSPAEEKLLLSQNGERDEVFMFLMWLTEQEAIFEAHQRYGEFSDGSQGNAFLHAYWNALMTLRFGEDFAEKFATAHETAAGNNISSQFMDMHNNQAGRNIGASFSESYAPSNPAPTELLVALSVAEAVNKGDLVILDNTSPYYSDMCLVCMGIH